MHSLQKHITTLTIKKSITTLICTTFLCIQINAQDLNFSQYFNSPLLTNPANTGFAPDFDFRGGINYRNKWGVAQSNPYKTMSAWGDAQLLGDKLLNGWVGIGGSLLTDIAGAGNLRSTKGYLSLAYHQVLSDNSLLSGGFGVGMVQKRVDFTKLTFDNQWNGSFFDIAIPNGETFATNAVNYLDLSIGLNYAWFASDNFYLNLGVSLQHFNRPRESFFASSNDARVAQRSNAFVNASIKLNDFWILNPNLYYSNMAKTTELVGGLRAFRNLSGDGMQQLILGLYYRNGDAAIPMVGYQAGNMQLLVNYDATINSATSFNQTRGAYELSIIFNGLYKNNSKNLDALRCSAPKF
ncbi:MAG: PorP/SprF family type IX secretion system membrane protein [Chitinophagaceae bacterium]|jgi:type IX secretion system PorP/SprF family membrane protein